MRLSELIGLRIVTGSGRTVGQVVDFRCAGEPEAGEPRTHRTVTEVIYGRVGWIERLGFAAVRKKSLPWSAVASFKGGRFVLREEEPPGE